MNYRSVAEEIFLAGVDRVRPDRLIGKAMSATDNCLLISDLTFDLDSYEHIYVIGAGKASALMGAAIEKILGQNISEGHIIVKYGHACEMTRIKVTEAGHPVPDPNGFKATSEILNICSRAGSNDLVICLLSGGGSALLSDCPEGVALEEMMNLTSLLVNSGASIAEINTVRKHLSKVKGGQLARCVSPGTMVTLILSDVVGDPLDVIASGPTVPDPTTYQQSLDILEKYSIKGSVSGGILSYLEDGARGKGAETPKPSDPLFSKTFNILIGNNKLALEAARQKASELNISAVIIDDRIEGDISAASVYITRTAFKFQNDVNVKKPVCLLFGGEPTVKVTGKGLGGRNQHLALICAVLLKDRKGITVLSAGTDGTDGPTSAAGAVTDCTTFMDSVSKGIEPEEHLREFDSFNFFRKAGGHIITGPTMTNVMDVMVVIVE